MACMNELGFALAPLFLLLFTYEMSSIQDLYDAGTMSDKKMHTCVTGAVLKLPASLLLPAFFGAAGIAGVCMVDMASVIYAVCRKRSMPDT